MSDASRILNPTLRSKIMSADEAAALIGHGDNVGMSGFTGAGYPKVVPAALARRIDAAHAAGQEFRVGVWTARPPRPNWTARWPGPTASSCACPTSPTPPAAPASMPARWSTWTSTCRTWPSSSGSASSAR
jgi:succinyl-CoA:acetate CoA-transferase